MNETTTTASVRKQVTVQAAPERAFDVFTAGMGTWWPLETHHIGATPAAEVIFEGRPGGRLFERDADGNETQWGTVRVWDRPHRLVYAWQISAEWAFDAAIDSEVEVRFIAEGPSATRVEIEHRNLDAFGPRAEEMRATFDGEGGWSSLVQAFADAVAGA